MRLLQFQRTQNALVSRVSYETLVLLRQRREARCRLLLYFRRRHETFDNPDPLIMHHREMQSARSPRDIFAFVDISPRLAIRGVPDMFW